MPKSIFSYTYTGDSSLLPLFLKIFGNMPLFPNYLCLCLILILDYFKFKFQWNTRFVQNRVMPDQTKKKKSMELEFQNAAIGVPERRYSWSN